MSDLCEECGAPLSIGQGSAEVEIDSLKMEVEQLQSELSAARALVSRPRAELQEEVDECRRLLRQAVDWLGDVRTTEEAVVLWAQAAKKAGGE